MVLGVVTTLPQHLNSPSRENSWVSTKPSSSPILFWISQHHKLRLLRHLNAMTKLFAFFMGSGGCNLLRWWIRKKKTSHASFSVQIGKSGQFHWPRVNDRWIVPLNKVIIKIQTPDTSANGRTYFISEEEKNKTQKYFERTSV